MHYQMSNVTSLNSLFKKKVSLYDVGREPWFKCESHLSLGMTDVFLKTNAVTQAVIAGYNVTLNSL